MAVLGVFYITYFNALREIGDSQVVRGEMYSVAEVFEEIERGL